MADGPDMIEPATADSPPRRVVLLGASNIARGIVTVLRTAEHVWGAPLEVLAAQGRGRSYGAESRVMGRRLGGILQSGLWDALAARPAAATAALVTDVGNDIVYGVPVARILAWVEQCLDRLAAVGARIVLTRLPMDAIAAITPLRFRIVRGCIFPGCRFDLNEAVRRAEAVDAGLVDMAARRNIPLIRPAPEWYGLDPIHIRRRFWQAAWRQILGAWCDGPLPPANGKRGGGIGRWFYLQGLRPQRQSFFGVEQRAAQPCGRLPNGTTIALY